MVIYKVTNTINGKVYIGQTKIALSTRWSHHCTQHACRALRRAIDKYGRQNFTIEVIDGANSPGELNYLEKKHIIEYNSIVPNGYNILAGGTSSYKMTLEQSKRVNDTDRKTTKGQKHGPLTVEQKNRISRACSNRTFSTEHKEKLRLAKLNKPSNNRKK